MEIAPVKYLTEGKKHVGYSSTSAKQTTPLPLKKKNRFKKKKKEAMIMEESKPMKIKF